MVWVKLDDAFGDHPKVLGLSDTAFRLYVTSLCYSSRYLTDGKVPAAFASNAVSLALDAEQSPIRELLDAALWLNDSDDPNGYEIHDYLAYNPSREDVRHERERVAERQRRFRGRTNAESNGSSNGQSNGVTNSVPVPVPVPLRTKKPSSDPSLFDAFWKPYPRKESRLGARSKFNRLVDKGIAAAEIIAGAERYRDDPNRDEEYTKLPTTWLNNGCWEDAPLPARSEGKPTGPPEPPRPYDHARGDLEIQRALEESKRRG